ncbi:EF-hand calcium-binding domain-containing protein 5 [Bulinus truncatus]|nr:EF-hand calcium-binding domain-containing protein 5 [Bulinus truncatus]
MFDAWEEEPDGGLTLAEMQVASVELAKVQQEVHRLATIATVQDKSAVEKWKIKQLSEKSEGMRWKLYKYNVTDFMTIVEYNYFDTLEAPKQNLNLQERIETGNMRHHDLHQMTSTRTKEERDAVLGRVKQIEESEVTGSEGGENAQEESEFKVGNTNENKIAKEGVESFNNNSRKVGELCSWFQEKTDGNGRKHRGDNTEGYNFAVTSNEAAESVSVLTQTIYYCLEDMADEAQDQEIDSTPDERSLKLMDKNNNMSRHKEIKKEDSTSDTDTTVTELGLFSNTTSTKCGDSTDHELFTSDETQASDDPNASDATFEESDEEVWFEKLSKLRKTLANVIPAEPNASSSMKQEGGLSRTESSLKDFSSDSFPPLSKSNYLDRSTTPYQPLPPIMSKKHVRFQSSFHTEDKGTQFLDDEGEETGENVEGENQINDIEIEQNDGFETNEAVSETAGEITEVMVTEDTQLQEEKSETETLQTEKSDSEVLQKEPDVPEAKDKEGDKTILEGEMKSLDNYSFKEEPVSSIDEVPENPEELIKDVPENPDKPDQEAPENRGEHDQEAPENRGDSFPEVNQDKPVSSSENSYQPSDELVNPETSELQDGKTEMNASELNDDVSEKQQDEKRDTEKDSGNDVGKNPENVLEKDVDDERQRNEESEKELAAQQEEEKEKDDADDGYTKTPHLKRFDSFMISQQERQVSEESGNSASRDERNAISTNQRSQSQLSAFDESTLNISQFVLLIETLLGHDPSKEIFERLVKHIKDGYTDTEQEKMDRLVKTRRQVISAKRKLMIDNLFEKWDNDGSGYLEMEEIQEVLFKYKDGQELDVIKRAQNALRKKSKFHDQRLSKQEFRELIELVVKEMSGSENFEQLVEFLMNSVERSYAERIRGEARKKWLQQIISAGQVSGTLLDPVYKAVFQALYKDAEMHGGEKRISANISMLESNKIDSSRGTMLLRYAACTPEDCPYMLGKTLFKNMKGVSFQAVETGKPVHVPRVSNHGNIYFWNYDRTQEEREGSFVAVPLKDKKKRVFGVLGIDTIQDPNKKSIFITHEIQFFQGVAKAFSIAYHSVEMRRKLSRVAESAISWLNRRCPHITEIVIYLVEPNVTPNRDPVLRKMMVAKKGSTVPVTEVIRLERKDNLFRDYLFQCMENSETVCADAYGERHTSLPLRDLEGKAMGVLDISIGDMKQLPHHENREAQRMLRLLQKAVKEIIREAQGEEKKKIIDAESDEASRVAIMFDSLMLAELRENVSKLDPMAWAELKSYYQPPKVILEICRAALAIFDIERAGEGQYEDWPIVKNNIHLNLIHQIKTYDPTKVTELAKTEKIARYLRAIPHGEVGRYGSIPAMLLYNWVFCCLSLIEHTIKMRELEAQNEALNPDIKPSNTK